MDQTTPETEVSQGITEEQAMQELLGKWGATEQEEPEAEEAESQESTEETEAEQPEGDAEQEAEAEQTEEAEDASEVEIDVAGEKFKVPQAFAETAKRIEAKAKEVEAGATRKFQEAADARKAAEAQIESARQLQKIATAQADLLADHRMVVRRLQTLENIDINATDADTLTRLNAEYNQLQAARARIEQQYQQGLQQMQEEEGRAIAAKRELGEKQLSSKLKGWGPEYAKKLAEYAISKGAPHEVLNSITDAWMVEILDDAAYGAQMRQAKPDLKKVAQPTKTLKPGSTGATKPAAAAKAEQALIRSKKSGRVEDAAMALLARSATRKK
jgi:hypothetical protein